MDGHDLDDRPSDPVVLETWLGASARSCARRPATVLDVLDRAVSRWPDRTAFGAEVSCAGFAGRVETTAAALRARGLPTGASVAAGPPRGAGAERHRRSDRAPWQTMTLRGD